ncbi:MAG: CoF synthetase, partial [Symbiobacteriaceae bacterium]|nr:CoF synthetase [Symbiobacteriaceae bacterium]
MNERLLILLSFIQYRWFSRFTTLRALRQHQRRLLKRQLAFVKAKSPFYRNKSSLPIMDKNTFMEQFEAVNTVQITRKSALDFALACEQTREFSKKLRGVTVGLSSGTSGNRGIFLVSDRERALWAGAMLAKTLPKGHLWGVRIAFFMRANSELYQTIQSPFIEFRFFDMLGDMEAALGALGAYQPTILVAPPSCLLQIAKWNRSGQINPRKVISIAEVLEDTDATTIRKAFGISVVHQVYQCTEGF